MTRLAALSSTRRTVPRAMDQPNPRGGRSDARQGAYALATAVSSSGGPQTPVERTDTPRGPEGFDGGARTPIESDEYASDIMNRTLRLAAVGRLRGARLQTASCSRASVNRRSSLVVGYARAGSPKFESAGLPGFVVGGSNGLLPTIVAATSASLRPLCWE